MRTSEMILLIVIAVMLTIFFEVVVFEVVVPKQLKVPINYDTKTVTITNTVYLIVEVPEGAEETLMDLLEKGTIK